MVAILKLEKSGVVCEAHLDDRFNGEDIFVQTDGELLYLRTKKFIIRINFREAPVGTTAELHILINQLYLVEDDVTIYFDRETSIAYKK